MKKSPQLISTSPIVPSVVFVLTNPLLFRKIFKDRSMRLIVEFSLDYRTVQPFVEKYIYIYRNETGVGWLYYVPFQSGWESRFRKVSLMNDGGVGFHDAEAKIRDLNSSIDSRARARSRHASRHASRSRVIHAYTPATRGGDSFIRASAGFGHALLHPCLSPCLPTGTLTFPPLPYRSNILFLILIAIANRPVTSSELQIKGN